MFLVCTSLLLLFQRGGRPIKHCLCEAHLVSCVQIFNLMGQNVNLAQQVAVQNVCCVFYYFCGGHKNNFPIWFRSSCKTFYNGRKIPIILPILKDGKLESDFKIQVNYFNFFFFFFLLLSVFLRKLIIALQLDLLQFSLTIMIFLKLSGL